MEMDWGTAIVGIISILLGIVPFVLVHYNRVKKERKMLQSLIENAQQHNCIINHHELCGDFVIGIDENRNVVFFLKQKKEESIFQFVNLSEVQTCQVVKKTRNTKNNVDSISIFERVELSFLSNKGKGETRLELYDLESNMQLSGELQLVEKWSKEINKRLKNI